MALSGQIVDFTRLAQGDDPAQAAHVGKVAVVQLELASFACRVLQRGLDIGPVEVGQSSAPGHALRSPFPAAARR